MTRSRDIPAQRAVAVERLVRSWLNEHDHEVASHLIHHGDMSTTGPVIAPLLVEVENELRRQIDERWAPPT